MPTPSWGPEEITNLVPRLTLEDEAALTAFSAAELIIRDGSTPGPLPDRSRRATPRPHGVDHLSAAWFLGWDTDSPRETGAPIQEAVREVSPSGIGAPAHNEGRRATTLTLPTHLDQEA